MEFLFGITFFAVVMTTLIIRKRKINVWAIIKRLWNKIDYRFTFGKDQYSIPILLFGFVLIAALFYFS